MSTTCTRIPLPDYFEIEDVLSQNALTASLRVRDRRTNRPATAKTLRPVAWMAEQERAENRRRAGENLRPLTHLHHPNLMPVYEVGEHEETFFAVREWSDGLSLRDLLDRYGTLSLYEAHRMAEQAADAVYALAGAGIPHGALTADNLFIESDGTVRIADAGFSRTVNSLSLAGIHCRIAGRSQGRRAPQNDLKMLAGLTYEALTGAPPVHRDGTVARAYQLPQATREALYRALAGSAKFRSAAEFAAALIPPTREELFRYAWRPAAAAGLFGALVTMGGSAYPSQPGRKVVPIVHRPAVVAIDSTLPILTQDDMATLRLAIRRQGFAALTHPAVAEMFGLSEQQVSDITDCLVEQRMRIDAMVDAKADSALAGDQTTGAPADVANEMRALREATDVRALSLLDEAQRARWDALSTAPPTMEEPIL